jgi:hypothetical protein
MADIMDIRLSNVKATPYCEPEKPKKCAVMPMAVYRFGRAKREERDAQLRKQDARASIDPALKVLLDRRDDRLLRDAGLTRESVLGEGAYFWSEWSLRRDPWNL